MLVSIEGGQNVIIEYPNQEIVYLYICTLGPLIIESFGAEKQVSTGALRALDNPLVVQTKI